jgi:hypothetical protein
MDCLMKHHGTGPLSNGSNGAFGYPILMMGADARIAERLTLIGTVLYKMLGTGREVVHVIVFDVDAMLIGPSFKLVLGLQRFTDSKGDLVGMADHDRCMVDEESPAGVLLGLGLFPFRMWETTMERRHVLISRDAAAGEKIAGSKDMLMIRIGNLAISAGALTALASKLTSCA